MNTTAVNLDGIPAELKRLDQWVVWRLEERDSKPTKPPRTPGTGKLASSTDPQTWGTFDEAVHAYQSNGAAGIGFVFSADDPFAGVDLDRCVGADGALSETAQWLVDRLDSYAELSPSGRGVHIMVRGRLPAKGNRKKLNEVQAEFYDHGRYFTLTGHRLANAPATIEDRHDRLRTIHNRAFPPVATPRTAPLAQSVDLADHELIERAMSARDGGKFRKLWEGDTSGYPSQSEADLALASKLAFWTGGDPSRIDALFRQSGLMREKWDREAYRQGTIEKALSSTTLKTPPVERKLPPPKVHKLDHTAARAKLDRIFRLGERVVQTGIELCRELADFIDGGGREVLAGDEGPLPLSYIANPLSVTVGRISQMAAAGRAWRRCFTRVNDDPLLQDITERHLRHLVKLGDDTQPEALTSACAIAREAHEVDQAQRQAAGRRGTKLRLRAKHVRAAVDRMLPPKPQPSAALALRRLVRQAYDACAANPDVPADLLAHLEKATQAALAWADGEARP